MSKALRKAQAALQGVIAVWAVYEEPLGEDQCRQTSALLSDLLTALAHLPAQESKDVVELAYLQERAEEARLQVAAFTPHCHKNFRQRRSIVGILRELVPLVSKLLPTASTQRPNYLRLVRETMPDDAVGIHQERNQAMRQWEDDTLVSVWHNKGQYTVVELPARQCDVFLSARSFPIVEQAEDYIGAQYEGVLRVAYEDIQEEQARRQARAEPHEVGETALPSFDRDACLVAIKTEMAYWREANELAYEKRHLILRALQHERSAVEQIRQAVQAEARAEWAQAASCYACAVNALCAALAKWSCAIEVIADKTPFDGFAVQGEPQYRFAPPPSLSLEAVEQISPYLLRIYASVGRVLDMWQDLLPRQVHCLTKTVQAKVEACDPTSNATALAP
jgi:hypothetical protein